MAIDYDAWEEERFQAARAFPFLELLLLVLLQCVVGAFIFAILFLASR